MISRTSLLLLTLTGAAALSIASPVHAQEDPRKAQAEALFQEGLKLHDKDREAEALEKFQRSYGVYPSPATLVSIGREEQLLGRALAALRHYREALKQPLLNPKYAQLAKQYIAEIEIRFGKLSVTGPSGTKFSMYGETFRLPMEEPLDVEPGTVLLHGEHDGRTLEGTVLAVSGKVVVLDLKERASEPAVKAPGEGGAGVTMPPPEVRERSFWDVGRVAGLASFGVGLVGLGLGASFGASSRDAGDRADGIQKPLGRASCSGSAAAASCADLNGARDSQERDATLSTVFLVAGGALGVAGAVLFFWPRGERVSVVPAVGGNSTSLLLTGRF